MGIRRLTRHLIPFSEPVLLTGRESTQERRKCVRSVVIDGPSLVYHIFLRLLSWTDTILDFPDIQPTCNEVSCAVMVYLLKLTILGVDIKAICFDGALPVSKRGIRLCRLEKARQKLEASRYRAPNEQMGTSDTVPMQSINLTKVMRGRTLAARHRGCPDNPFMVPAVFEDLKYRWNKENILETAREFMSADLLTFQGFPWADVTVMVPGEADMYCADVARLTGSAVLTSDSDLILYNLGLHGSVMLLDSVELGEAESFNSTELPILAERLCPASIAHRLGLTDLLRFAYELKIHPNLGLSELIRLAKKEFDTPQASTGYMSFIEEYQDRPKHVTQQPHLDPRVSELVWQYEFNKSNFLGEIPQVYLVILSEDPTRKCAWENGISYRTLGYSILNVSRPPSERYASVDEFVRRGGRIVKDRMALSSEDWIAKEMSAFRKRLGIVAAALKNHTASPRFWRIFALCEIYGWESSGFPLPGAVQFSRFLTLGHMGGKLEWADIHLAAQVQAVLYSLRILRQLLELALSTDNLIAEIRHRLSGLPPLHIMMRSRREMTSEGFNEEAAYDFIERFYQLTR